MSRLADCTYSQLRRLLELAAPGSPDHAAILAELAVRDEYERTRVSYSLTS